MKWSGQSRTRVFSSFLLSALALFVWLTPDLAAAADFGTFRLWEIQEFLRFKPKGTVENIVLRLANATLVGEAMDASTTEGPCLRTGQFSPCPMDIRATSAVNLKMGSPKFGTGRISGRFNILLDSNPASPLLSDLVLAATATFEGTIDLLPAIQFQASAGSAGAPIATINGKWQSPGLHAGGDFTGTFLIPIPSASCPKGFAYFIPSVLFECLTDAEFSLGVPVTQLGVTLMER